MKIATWNVNSLRVRLPHVLTWLESNPIDVLALQETKLIDAKFPLAELQAAGYEAAFAGQPTYNGVALLHRRETVPSLAQVVVNNPLFADEQVRIIAASCQGLRICCGYFPNGQEVGSDKYQYKLSWLDALIDWVKDGAGDPSLPLVLLGDFNIAPDDRDVHDPAAWEGKILCSDAERARFKTLIDLGHCDSFRLFEQPAKTFSWWDYRQLGFRRNAGLRIDHILVSESLCPQVVSCAVDRIPRKWDKPSDHAPVVIELAGK